MARQRKTDPSPGCPRGFTLIETLVALAVVAVAVTMLATIVGHEPRALQRIDAHREAYTLLEDVIEGVRAGAVPLASLEDLDASAWLPARPTAQEVSLEAEINPHLGRLDLTRIRLTVHYKVTGGAFTRSVETLHWRPPSS